MQFDILADEMFAELCGTFGTLVNYKRAGVSGASETLLNIKAIPTKPDTPLDRRESQLTASIDREFIMQAASLEISGVRFDPKPGDRIIETESGSEYEVRYKTGQNCWRLCEPGKTLIRISTKKTK